MGWDVHGGTTKGNLFVVWVRWSGIEEDSMGLFETIFEVTRKDQSSGNEGDGHLLDGSLERKGMWSPSVTV